MQEKAKRKFGKEEPHPSNVLRLVKALLLLPKGDLKLEDSQLTAAVKVEWVVEVENRLLVTGEYKEKTRTGKEKLEFGTTKQALWQLVEKTDTPLELPQRQREDSSRTEQEQQDDVVRNALDYLDYLGVFKDERPKNKRNTRYWKFTLTLQHKDASLEENLGVVQQKLGLETSPSIEDAGTLPLSFWQDCCRKMLPTALSINPLLHGDGVVLTIEDIVPLELVERKQRPQQKDDFSPEHFQVQAPIEYEVPVEHNKFLAQVLETGDSLKNRDRKIAVIGEPGAGKTTLLQEIAKEVEGAGGLPIFVRLADLGEKTLKDYLLEDWLEEATGKRYISDDTQDEFVEQFNLGRVWLLLDGVDEIAATGNLLSGIEKQLKGWVTDARIVLTCRLNVWDVGKNELYAFEKYRIQQLSYPDIVVNFIHRFFFKAGEPTKGEKLIEKLERSQPRIRDLVKNPLRLTLLCRTWKRRQGELPQTKAELYKGFVETFYQWKDKPEIDSDKRQLLEQALGEMAKNAIDKETTKFRLRESFVRQELDKFDKSLFDLACRVSPVSWINNVGVAAENSDEPVYAFFHPTFQEYFAALAIADWDFFLPRAHDNHNPKPVSDRYRIFEPQWKEVILLWLGRPHEEVVKKQKEEFIKALVEFEDGIKDLFYCCRAYFLAATGITELWDCCLADQIVKKIISISFGYFDIFKSKWVQAVVPIAERAREVLQETHREKVVQALSDILPIIMDEGSRLEAAFILGKIDSGNPLAIQTLIQLGQTAKLESNRKIAFENLTEIGKGKLLAIQTLIQLIEKTKNDEILSHAVQSLGQVGKNNPLAHNTLTKLVQKDQDDWLRCIAAESLEQSDLGKTLAIETWTELMQTSQNEFWRCISACNLKQIDKYNYLATQALNDLAQTSQDEWIRQEAARSLGQDNYSHQPSPQKNTGLISFKAIIEAMMQTHENELFDGSKLKRHLYARLLVKNLQGDYLRLAVFRLKNCLTDQVYKNDCERFKDCYSVIWHCAQNMTYPAFYQAWHQQEEVDNATTPNSQSLNETDLPQRLHTAIANDPQLSQTIHLICIDGSQIIDPYRPAAEIYDQMLDQNCPECDSVPETMPALKLYWNSLKRNSDKQAVLVFYASSTDPYSEALLKDLSKFGRAICVITEQLFDLIRLKFFVPSQAIADVVEWIRAIERESLYL